MFHIRAAISLNNTAVCLIERKCYVQASETLRDALETLRASFSAAACPESEPELPVQAIAAKLQKAAIHLMNLEPNCQASIHTVTVNSDWLPTKALAGIREGPTTRKACAIRIELCELQDPERLNDVTAETAIVLHNLAVSYLCLLSAPAMTRPGYRRVVKSLLVSSYQMLQAHRAESGGTTHIYCLLSLEVIILGKLIACTVDENVSDQAGALHDEYAHLCGAMVQMEGLEECFQNGRVAAAAA